MPAVASLPLVFALIALFAASYAGQASRPRGSSSGGGRTRGHHHHRVDGSGYGHVMPPDPSSTHRLVHSSRATYRRHLSIAVTSALAAELTPSFLISIPARYFMALISATLFLGAVAVRTRHPASSACAIRVTGGQIDFFLE